jgi:uncharacterized protein with LGFP repeats
VRVTAPVERGAFESWLVTQHGGLELGSSVRMYSTSTGFYFLNDGYPGGSNGILPNYLAHGADWGFLGLPTSAQYGVDDTHGHAGLAERFEGGRIYQCGYLLRDHCSITQAHEVHGAILWHFDHAGGLTTFGYPANDEQAAPGGRISYFQHGAIYWNATTETITAKRY